MEEVKQQLELLSRYGVECVIVGGVAAALHGSSIPTYDLDVCYARDAANLHRLAEALTAVHATLRGAPKNLPFILDADTLRNGLNFTFDTDIGPLDVLGEIAGVGGFADARDGGKNKAQAAIVRTLPARKIRGLPSRYLFFLSERNR